MKRKAEETEPYRVFLENLGNNGLKIFGDVFEALVAAVFLDSGGDLDKIREIFIDRLLRPYLLVYGNLDAIQEHPRTEVINLWGKEPMANIRDHQIKIMHGATLVGTEAIMYKGYIGEVQVISRTYGIHEKSKLRRFFAAFRSTLSNFLAY